MARAAAKPAAAAMAPLADMELAADLPGGVVAEGPPVVVAEPLGLGTVGVVVAVPLPAVPVVVAAAVVVAVVVVAASGAAKATAAKARTATAVNFMLVRMFGGWGVVLGEGWG